MCGVLGGFGGGVNLVPDASDVSAYGPAAAGVLQVVAGSLRSLLGQVAYNQCAYPLYDLNDAPMCHVAWYMQNSVTGGFC